MQMFSGLANRGLHTGKTKEGSAFVLLLAACYLSSPKAELAAFSCSSMSREEKYSDQTPSRDRHRTGKKWGLQQLS